MTDRTAHQAVRPPMTADQAAQLKVLCKKTGEEVEDVLTMGQAQRRIDALQGLDTLPCK